jgi:hypothetical protein
MSLQLMLPWNAFFADPCRGAQNQARHRRSPQAPTGASFRSLVILEFGII